MSRWFTAGLLLLVMLIAGVYFFSAQIITGVAIELADTRGFLLQEVSLQRPEAGGIHIDQLAGDVSNFHIVAQDIDVSYSFEGLLAQSVDAVSIRNLQIQVNETSAAASPTQPGTDASNEFDPATIFGIVPQLSVDKLLLEIVQSNFVGTGNLKLDGDNASFELAGVQPEIARNLSVTGMIQSNTKLQFRFFDTYKPDEPFLQLIATSEDDDIDVTGDFDLSGYPLSLVAAFLSLPDGSGRVKGELASRLEAFDIIENYQTLDLTGSYQIDWRNEDLEFVSLHGLLSGSLANMALTLAGGNIAFADSAVRFTVAPGTTMQYTDNQISIDAKFAVAGYGLEADGSVLGDIGLQTNTVVADLNINVGDMGFPLHLSYDSVSGRADFGGESRIVAHNLGRSLVQNWPYDFDIVGGDVDIDLQGVLLDGAINARAAVALTRGTVRYDEFEFFDTTAGLNFLLDSSNLLLQPSSITVGKFDFGVALRDAEMKVAWHDDVVELDSGHFDLLGGSVTIAPTQYDLIGNKANLDLVLANIDLAQVMALEGDDIKGEGRLYGTLPVRIIDGEVSMSNGQIRASEAGGVIQISPEFDLGIGQPGIDFALRALANFNYQSLNAVADFEQNGDLQLAVSLQGQNPEIEKGRPIRYNLNINENVFSLIEALNAESRVVERVERGVMKK